MIGEVGRVMHLSVMSLNTSAEPTRIQDAINCEAARALHSCYSATDRGGGSQVLPEVAAPVGVRAKLGGINSDRVPNDRTDGWEIDFPDGGRLPVVLHGCVLNHKERLQPLELLHGANDADTVLQGD